LSARSAGKIFPNFVGIAIEIGNILFKLAEVRFF